MSRRLVTAIALAAAAAGATLAIADDPPPAAAPPARRTAPEVPGVARRVVPFGVETTASGPRTWALGDAGGRTVALRRAPGGAWSTDPLPVDGVPVGGAAPQHAGEAAPDGHAAVLLADPKDPSADAALATREPDRAFVAAPPLGAALQPDERLVRDATQPSARALLAVVGGTGPDAGTFLAPTTADGDGRAVLRLGPDGWTREPIDAPDLTGGPLRPVGLAAAPTGGQAWMLARAGDALVLLERRPQERDPEPGDPGTGTGTTTAPVPAPADPDPPADDGRRHWVPADVAAHPLLAGAPRPAGVSAVTAAAPPADPLTVTEDGLWIDLQLATPGGSSADATLHLKVAAGADAAARRRVAVDGSWCDLAAAGCDHPLGLTFPSAARGYRSLAYPATAEAPFGRRVVSSPVDVGVPTDAPRRDAERQGGYAELDGDRFAFRPGVGDDGTGVTQAVAFSADGTGVVGGTLAVGVATTAAPRPPAPDPAFDDPVVAAVPSPEGDGRVLAYARQLSGSVFTPGKGWQYAGAAADALRYGTNADGDIGAPSSDRPRSRVRALAWPRPNLLIGAGSAGLLNTVHGQPEGVDPALMEDGVSGTVPPTHSEQLPVEATFLAVACTAADPLECVAVGRGGLLMRGDGDRWATEHLPGAGATADITSATYEGRTAVLATSDGLYRGTNGAWTRDDDLRDRMARAGQGPATHVVDSDARGGTVVDGLWERDDPAAGWRPTNAPLTLHPLAISAVRDEDGHVRTLVVATPTPTPLPTPVTVPGPTDPDEETSSADDEVPPDPSPQDPVTLRETADGWIDTDRASYQGSGGRDLPATTPGSRVLVVDDSGTGWALGGQSSDEVGRARYSPAVAATTTAGWLERGAAAAAPEAITAGVPASVPTADEVPAPVGVVRLAVGGHPACLDRCTGGAGQGTTPDVHLERAVARVAALQRGGAGPAALIVGGGRASVGGEPLDEAGARRYRALLDGAGVPTYALPGPGDLPRGGAAAFRAAFSTAAAPVGDGPPAESVAIDAGLQPPADAGPRTRFVFDVRGAAGTVRVMAIDNVAGRLEGGPTGAQAQWMTRVLDDARGRGLPVVVVGSAALTPVAKAVPAEDAADEIALLAGRASAYVSTAGVDDPGSPQFGGALSRTTAAGPGETPAPLAVFQSSALGYRVSDAARAAAGDGEDDIDAFTRQTTAALLLLDVDVAHVDAATGVAPVTSAVEPLLGRLEPYGSVMSMPLGAASPLVVNAEDPAPQRYLWRAVDGVAQVAGAPRSGYLPSNFCAIYLTACADALPDDIRFTSSDPAVGRFVAVRPAERNSPPTVVLDDRGDVVEDARSGIFCPVGVGSTTVTIQAMGQRVQTTVNVETVRRGGRRNGSRPEPEPVPVGTCSFRWSETPDKADDPATPEAPAAPSSPAQPAPPVAPVEPAMPSVPTPTPAAHVPTPAAPAPPTPAAPLPTPLPLPPMTAQPPLVDHTAPPAAPATKPPSPLQPPPPPAHGQVLQPSPSPQVQAQVHPAVRAAEERRREEAFQSDHAAVAYRQPASPLPWEIAGGVATLLLVAGGGFTAGRIRRRTSPVYARARR